MPFVKSEVCPKLSAYGQLLLKLAIHQSCDTSQTACFSGSKCFVTQNSDIYLTIATNMDTASLKKKDNKGGKGNTGRRKKPNTETYL